MRTDTKRALCLIAALLVVLGAMAAPSAGAQTTDPYANPLAFEDPVLCGGEFYGRVSGGQPPYMVFYVLDGADTYTLPPFALAAPGPFRSPSGYAVDVPDGTYTVTGTVTDAIDQVEVKVFTATLEATCIGSGGLIPGGPIANGPGAAPSSIPVVKPVPVVADEPLAVTGGNIDMPGLIGFSLVGAGGLVLLAGRRRRLQAESKAHNQ